MKSLFYNLFGLCLLFFSNHLAAQPSSLKNGLIAHYLFNNDVNDKSGNNNDGTMHGGLQFGEDRFGNKCGALHFNGLDSYVKVPTSKSLESPSDELTVTTWFKLDQEATDLKWLTVCCKSDNILETDDSPQYRMQATRATLSINTDFTENLSVDVSFDTWYHYAMVYDGSTVVAYLDARKVFEYNYSQPFYQNKMPLEIGRDVPGVIEYFAGSLDDLRIYNRGLRASEVQAVFNDDSERSSPKPCGTILKPHGKPPVISVISPPNSPYAITQPNYQIEAYIQNISNDRDLRFFDNGSPSTKFSFDPFSKTFKAHVALSKGHNFYYIEASNQNGEDKAQIFINFQNNSPKTPPVIKLSAPSSSPEQSAQPNYLVKAEIENIVDERDVKFFLNGKPRTDFSFQTHSKLFSASIPLELGNNFFEIEVANEDGKDKTSGIINYNPAPVITLLDPPQNPHHTTEKDQQIKARIEHVNSDRDVSFTLNGNRNKNFSFDPRSGMFIATSGLDVGNNFIEIEAVNKAGKDKASTVVTYKPEVVSPKPPSINLTTPASERSESNLPTQLIKAKIENISERKDISFSFNGNTNNQFDYDLSKKTFSAEVSLDKGNNFFQIKAVNQDGSDEVFAMVSYNPIVPDKFPPKITIQDPDKTPFDSNTPKCQVKARIENVDGKADIQFKINGQIRYDFNFDPQNHLFLVEVPLNTGYNVYEIKAKNKDGEDEVYGQIAYKSLDEEQLVTMPQDEIGKINIIEQFEVKSPTVKLVCYDHQKEDGDIVSVLINGKILIDKVELKSKGVGEIHLDLPPFTPYKEYVITAKAWNTGQIYPNTMTLEIHHGTQHPKRVILESDIGNNEAIKLIYRN